MRPGRGARELARSRSGKGGGLSRDFLGPLEGLEGLWGFMGVYGVFIGFVGFHGVLEGLESGFL